MAAAAATTTGGCPEKCRGRTSRGASWSGRRWKPPLSGRSCDFETRSDEDEDEAARCLFFSCSRQAGARIAHGDRPRYTGRGNPLPKSWSNRAAKVLLRGFLCFALVSCVRFSPLRSSPVCWLFVGVCFPAAVGSLRCPRQRKKKKRGACHACCDWGHGLGCRLWAVGWAGVSGARSRERSTWSSAAILSKSRKQSHSHRGPEASPLALCLTPTRHDRAAGLCSSTLLRGYRYIAALGSYHHSFFIANARTATRTHQPTANAFQPII